MGRNLFVGRHGDNDDRAILCRCKQFLQTWNISGNFAFCLKIGNIAADDKQLCQTTLGHSVEVRQESSNSIQFNYDVHKRITTTTNNDDKDTVASRRDHRQHQQQLDSNSINRN